MNGASVQNDAALLAAYGENARVAAAFWDWRHRLMTFFVAAMIALAALEGWLLDKSPGTVFLATPYFIGAFLAGAAAVLDRRITQILQLAYATGAKLEHQDSLNVKGIYTELGPARGGMRMRSVLQVAYCGASVGLGAVALVEVVLGLR